MNNSKLEPLYLDNIYSPLNNKGGRNGFFEFPKKYLCWDKNQSYFSYLNNKKDAYRLRVYLTEYGHVAIISNLANKMGNKISNELPIIIFNLLQKNSELQSEFIKGKLIFILYRQENETKDERFDRVFPARTHMDPKNPFAIEKLKFERKHLAQLLS